MSATVLTFPARARAAAASTRPRAVPTPGATPPRRFSAEDRAALLSLSYALPSCAVWFGRDEDGDEWAVVADTSLRGTTALSVLWDEACGRVVLLSQAPRKVGTYATAGELAAAIRRSWPGKPSAD